MTTLIRANEGAGEIAFGMTQDEVRSRFRDEIPRSKQTDTAVPADYFAHRGMIVHYDNDGVVEAIELGSAAQPEFMDQAIVGQPFEEVVEWFRRNDPRVELEDAGLTSYRFGIGIFAPHATKSIREAVEGVIVFRPGYYG